MKKNTHIIEKNRKILFVGLIFMGLALFMNSCDLIGGGETFDKTLLTGTWTSGTLHEHYNAAGTGYTWDTADDVTEAEAQIFTWTLEGSALTQIHVMEMGGKVPKTYTVTKLNATTLAYHDDYGKSYIFTKE